jgi:hypothetical protein
MLLWLDGFEDYGTSGNFLPTGVLGRKYGVGIPQAGYSGISTGRFGTGYCMYWAYDGSTYIQTPALTTNDTLIIGVAVKFPRMYDEGAFMVLYDGATAGVNFRFRATGEIAVYRDSTLLGTTSGASMRPGIWYFVEFKIKCNDSTGTYEVRIGGVTVGSGTGLDTKSGSNAYHDRVRITATSLNYSYYDDFYICDASGAANNDFLGNVKIESLRPNAAGDSTQLSPSAGDNYTCVDDAIANDDTDYVEDDTTDQKDLYNFGATTLTTINGVIAWVDCRETDADNFSVKIPCKSGATESDDTAQSVGTPNYVTFKRVLETDPNTAAAWATADLNAAQFGIKIG